MSKGLVIIVSALALAALGLSGQTVKITPLGAKTGEFCSPDRALILEDPTGVRILYDPGMTVAGGADPRLGDVHVILVSHAHGDHLGSSKLNQDPNSSSAGCGSGVQFTSAVPHSNAAEIAVAKDSAVVVSAELAAFLNKRITELRGGVATPGCPAAGSRNEVAVPRTAPCTGNLGFGAKRTAVRMPNGPGVEIAIVQALHGNGLAPDFLDEPEKSDLSANRINAYVGVATGYVLTFSNGLRVYLSGDTGHTADMDTIVRDFYRARLAVFNIGDIFTTGPEEAAFAVKELLKVRAVIPSHANEQATEGGVVRAGTRTARFIDLLDGPQVHVPLSGMTMQLDDEGRCVAGCGGPGRR